jgi:hypothetical protein
MVGLLIIASGTVVAMLLVHDATFTAEAGVVFVAAGLVLVVWLAGVLNVHHSTVSEMSRAIRGNRRRS